MDSQTSRKIIVAGSMAAVIGIGVATFALSSHHATSAAPTSQIPPTVVPTTDTPAAVAPTPDTAAAFTPMPAAPAVAYNETVGSKIGEAANPAAVEPKVPANWHLAKAPTRADSDARVVTPAEPSADEAQAKSVDGVKSVDEVTTPSPASGASTDAQAGAESTTPAAPDAGALPK
jgi:hypothetical protein